VKLRPSLQDCWPLYVPSIWDWFMGHMTIKPQGTDLEAGYTCCIAEYAIES
jgi:hypothetical protein